MNSSMPVIKVAKTNIFFQAEKVHEFSMQKFWIRQFSLFSNSNFMIQEIWLGFQDVLCIEEKNSNESVYIILDFRPCPFSVNLSKLVLSKCWHAKRNFVPFFVQKFNVTIYWQQFVQFNLIR